MLFGYQHLKDKIDDLQVFVNHTVLEILCKPRISEPFNTSFFHPRYRDIVSHLSDEHIYIPIENAYNICKNLSKSNLRLLENAVRLNNKIEGICNGTINPITYDDIEAIDIELKNNIYQFCKKLYENVLILKPFYSKFSHIDDHYKLFSEFNKFNRCPSCGLKRLLKPDEVDFDDKSKREAYDHYFNKARYPFSSVNFFNLIPICDDCNSKYKTQRDVINDGVKRVKAFFPYKDIPEITFNVTYSNIDNYELKNIDIDLICTGYNEELETWNRMFSVKSRYKVYYEGEDFKNYLEQALIVKSCGKEPINEYKKSLKNNIFANENFLKVPLLDLFFED